MFRLVFEIGSILQYVHKQSLQIGCFHPVALFPKRQNEHNILFTGCLADPMKVFKVEDSKSEILCILTNGLGD